MLKCLNNSFEYLKSTSELYLVFQPKTNIKTLNILGYEVLTRWKNKEYGDIAPIEFLPFFIGTNKIKEFDLFVFENAFKFQEELIKNNIYQQCSINLSVESFNDTDILKNICTLVDKYNISPDSITIEILEHKGLEDIKQSICKINILKNKGFKLSIDDFGMGYSSFNRLYNFDIDELKIDKELLIDIKNNKKQEIILKNIFNLANELNIETVVEGVETKDIFNLVKSIGFSNSQGHFHSKPLKKDDYIRFIKKNLQ